MTEDRKPPKRPHGVVQADGGVRFSLQSTLADAVELCLFEKANEALETRRVDLEPDGEGLWSACIEGLPAGSLYGYRVHGPYDPGSGRRCNPAKLLIDPRACAVAGELRADPSVLGYEDANSDTVPSSLDSAPHVPKAVVIDKDFDWEGDRPPRHPWETTLIYECHVKGLTQRHPDVPDALRGTYLGLSTEPILDHLRRLGVTAVELMPVQHFVSEPHLMKLGLENYFGYNPLAFFAPHAGYATGSRGEQLREFKIMVKRLHRAGIEVLVDIVLNHTAEGSHIGPTLSLRGIDNPLYYRLEKDDPARYLDFSGCGNTLDAGRPEVARMLVDCLCYWVEELHVDGFRFDLAVTLGRERDDFSKRSFFFKLIRQEPALSGIKLIAEPWDLGPQGYQLASFPNGWSEWNDRYRDAVRSFWRGDAGRLAEMADAVGGSRSIFGPRRRGPEASINFVTCHDGFTLHDLVSYERKHNHKNGENNLDGPSQNLSRNWGVEGPTSSPEILARRELAKRNLLATLAFSRGVPMLSHGDEIGRTQAGNNNAYCHDSELTWVHWRLGERELSLLGFVRRIFALRRRLAPFSLPGGPDCSSLTTLSASGRKTSRADLGAGDGHLFAELFRGTAGHYLLILNGGESTRLFRLPRPDEGARWRLLLTTLEPGREGQVGRSVRVPGFTLMFLSCGAGPGRDPADDQRETRP